MNRIESQIGKQVIHCTHGREGTVYFSQICNEVRKWGHGAPVPYNPHDRHPKGEATKFSVDGSRGARWGSVKLSSYGVPSVRQEQVRLPDKDAP